MLLRNWIELGILIALLAAGVIVKMIIHKKTKRVEGFKGLNTRGPGCGWKAK